MKTRLSLETIEQAIATADADKQRRLLRDLPHLLKMPAAELALLKAAEPAFVFWDNPDDIVYDRL